MKLPIKRSTTNVRPSKYGNRKTSFDGQTFDSAAEARRYQVLKTLEVNGSIQKLTCQVSFELAPKTVINGKTKRALTYRADFSYVENGKTIVEDVKGAITDVYKIKRHLMLTVHGIAIRETK